MKRRKCLEKKKEKKSKWKKYRTLKGEALEAYFSSKYKILLVGRIKKLYWIRDLGL